MKFFGDEGRYICYDIFATCWDIDLEAEVCKVEVNPDYSSYITVTYGLVAKYYYFIRRDKGSLESISYLRIGKTYPGPRSPFKVKNGTKLDICIIPEVNDILYLIKISWANELQFIKYRQLKLSIL